MIPFFAECDCGFRLLTGDFLTGTKRIVRIIHTHPDKTDHIMQFFPYFDSQEKNLLILQKYCSKKQ